MYCVLFRRNLPRSDTFSKSDPIVVISAQTADGKRTEIGRTESIE
jgi:hypothetical protein